MSRGGGWAWWPPSRRRRQQQQQRTAQPGRRGAAAPEPALGSAGPVERGRTWALAAAALLLLWLLVAALGLCGAGLSLAAAAAAGVAWAAGAPGRPCSDAPQPLQPRRAVPSPCQRSAGESAVANGGLGLAALREKSGGRPRFLGGNYLAPSAHFVLPPRRRYPIHQAQYASLGTLPSICWDGYRRKNRLSTHNSSMVQSPVTVKIARPDSSIARSPLLERLSSPGVFSPAPNGTPDLCAKEAVLNALKESRKRATMEEEEEEEETHHQSLPSGQESKRRRHGSSGSGRSVFEPLVANGVPASLVSKPGSLKRGLLSHCLDDLSSKRLRVSSLSSTNSLHVGGIPSSIRNVIASSYSSSRGLSQLWKRSSQSISSFSSPASSRSQTPERPSKKAKSVNSSLTEEETQQASISTPAKADKEVQAEKAAETPVTRHSLGSPSLSDGSRKRKRKIQLLSTRRADRFTLPPPPQLGYSATSEDLDADKKVTLQRFNKVLEEKADSTPGSSVDTASVPSTLSFTPLSAKSLPAPSAGTVSGTNPLLESLKKLQGEQSCSVQADAPAAAAETPRPLTPAASLGLSSSVSVTTPEAKPLPLALSVPASLAAVAPSSVAPAGGASCLATTSSSELGETPARPSSDPKPSVLGMFVSPPASQPVATTTVTSSVPALTPIFDSLAKSEGAAFSSSSAPVTAVSSPAPPGVVPPIVLPCGAPSSTFKPIFGDPPPPATTGLPSAAATTASLFTFKQNSQLAPAQSLPSNPTSGASGFPGLLEAIVATAASSPTTSSAAPASVSKTAFSFGLGVLAAPGSTTTTTTAAAAATTTTASTAKPFLFGSLPSATASGSATAPVFQFGKVGAAATEPTLNPAFSQVPPSSTAGPAPASAASFSIFGSGAQASVAPPATAQQPTPLTFGSCSSAFSSAAFGAPSKPPPPYTVGTSRLTLDVGAPDGQQPASKPGPSPMSFGAHFSFAGSVVQPVTQPAFGSTTQAPFGGSSSLASFGTKSTTQPAFGATTSVFSFGTASTTAASGFGATTQTTSSSTGGSVFGGSAPASFPFGASSQPAAAGSAFGLSAAGGGAGGPAVGFSFGSGQGGAAGAVPPFGPSLAQPPLGSQNQSTSFAFSIPGTTPEGKPAFGGAPTPTFGQGGGAAGSTLSFGVPTTPAFGGAGSTFGSTPTFSIGAGSKMGSRQRLQARRHNARKK